MFLKTMIEHCKVMSVYAGHNIAFANKNLNTATTTDNRRFWGCQLTHWTELKKAYENELKVLSEVEKNGRANTEH